MFYVLRCIETKPSHMTWYVDGENACGTSFAGAQRFHNLADALRAKFYSDHETEIVAVTYGVAWDVKGFPRHYARAADPGGLFGIVWTEQKKYAWRLSRANACTTAKGLRREIDTDDVMTKFKVVRFMKRVG